MKESGLEERGNGKGDEGGRRWPRGNEKRESGRRWKKMAQREEKKGKGTKVEEGGLEGSRNAEDM